MRIFIEPTEPLLFRTGRPFNAGENNFAETLFPPTPETLQGALRAMIAFQWGKAQTDKTRTINEIFNEDAVVKFIGRRVDDRNVYGQFRITGFTLGKRDKDTNFVERLFPAPAHFIRTTVYDEGKKVSRLVRLKPESRSEGTSNIPSGKLLLFPELQGKKTVAKSEDVTGWLTLQGLRAMLKGDVLKEEHLVAADAIYTRESRLGIGMNNATKTTQEGYLYQVQMIRMQPNYGFVVDIGLGKDVSGGNQELPYGENLLPEQETRDKLKFLDQGWLTMGGEQRAARFEILNIGEEQSINQATPGKLLYFATPAYFQNGWLPKNQGILPSDPITAAINRYQPIGGWFLSPQNAGGAGKITRRCVPAGSVYFFKDPVTITQPLTEYGWQIGYGIAYTGEY